MVKQFNFLNPNYSHSLGDFDYGLTLTQNGGIIGLVPHYSGKCNRNPILNTWRDINFDFNTRLKLLNSPKGRPFSEYKYFLKNCFGNIYVIFSFKPLLFLFYDQIRRLISCFIHNHK